MVRVSLLGFGWVTLLKYPQAFACLYMRHSMIKYYHNAKFQKCTNKSFVLLVCISPLTWAGQCKPDKTVPQLTVYTFMYVRCHGILYFLVLIWCSCFALLCCITLPGWCCYFIWKWQPSSTRCSTLVCNRPLIALLVSLLCFESVCVYFILLCFALSCLTCRCCACLGCALRKQCQVWVRGGDCFGLWLESGMWCSVVGSK